MHPGIIFIKLYRNANSTPKVAKVTFVSTLLNIVFNKIGIINQPININGINRKLKLPLSKLSKIT